MIASDSSPPKAPSVPGRKKMRPPSGGDSRYVPTQACDGSSPMPPVKPTPCASARSADDEEHVGLAVVHGGGRVDAGHPIFEVRVVRRELHDWLDEVCLVRLPFVLGLRNHGRDVRRSGEQPGRRRRALRGRLLRQRRRRDERQDGPEHVCAHESLLWQAIVQRSHQRLDCARLVTVWTNKYIANDGACSTRSSECWSCPWPRSASSGLCCCRSTWCARCTDGWRSSPR